MGGRWPDTSARPRLSFASDVIEKQPRPMVSSALPANAPITEPSASAYPPYAFSGTREKRRVLARLRALWRFCDTCPDFLGDDGTAMNHAERAVALLLNRAYNPTHAYYDTSETDLTRDALRRIEEMEQGFR